MNKSLSSIFIFLLFFAVTPYSQASPVDAFEQMQKATNYSEIEPYLSPESRALYEKYKPKQRDRLVAYNRYSSYKRKVFSISPNRIILVVYDIIYSDLKRQVKNNKSKPKARIAYEFLNIRGKWVMNGSSSANMIISGLLEKIIEPSQFRTENNFSYVGEPVIMKSAFAYSTSDGTVTIEFFPFPFSHSDIDYYKFNSGNIKKETGKASAITSSARYPSTKLVLSFKDSKLYFWSIIFSKFSGIPFSETLGTNDISLIKTIKYDGKNIIVKSNSSFIGLDGKKGIWDININLPVFRRGL